MASLTYSKEAVDTLRYFHRVRHVVFVEGSDDVVFWARVFNQCGLDSVHLKRAGGVEELDKYCDAIIENDAEIMVARDSDHSEFEPSRREHARIIYTYGYSIENSMCTVAAVARVAERLSHSTTDLSSDVERQLNAIIMAIEPIVHGDVAARLRRHSGRVPLANCREYLAKNACRIVRDKVSNGIRAVHKMLRRADIEAARQAVQASGKPLTAHIRGHFLLSAVSAILHDLARVARERSVSLSNDALFALLLGEWHLAALPAAEAGHFVSGISAIKAAA